MNLSRAKGGIVSSNLFQVIVVLSTHAKMLRIHVALTAHSCMYWMVLPQSGESVPRGKLCIKKAE